MAQNDDKSPQRRGQNRRLYPPIVVGATLIAVVLVLLLVSQWIDP